MSARSLLAALSNPDPIPGLIQADRDLSRRKLPHFVRLAWHILEPATPYIHGRVIDAICEHLEAVSNGQINRLLICVPPGTAKSLLTSVFWPMWQWGPMGAPHLRFLSFSYSERLSIRDNRRSRMLIESEWFQRRWPIRITSDQNQKSLFENESRGWRMASSVGGVGTGARGDVLLVDDPHHVSDGESPAALESALLWFNEVLPTRLNNPAKSAIVVIQQRVHERDVAGEIIAKELGYEKLILPMLYEPERRCTTSIGFSDWRTKEGELLFPERFPPEVVERDKKAMGSYAFATQMQQAPAPRGGGLFKVERLTPVDDWPRNARAVRAWDFAASEARAGADPDYTVGAKLAEQDGLYWIVDIVRGRWSPGDVEQIVATTAWQDGANCLQVIEQEPGSSGKAFVDHYMRRVLKGHAVQVASPSGSKVQRAVPFAASVEAGNVRLVKGAWNEDFLAEARVFPAGSHDDQVDGVSLAWSQLGSSPFLYIG